MFKNYVRLAIRNLFKNKLSSAINIIGLAVAIGCSIVFFLLLYLEYTSDHFHNNVKQIYMIGYSLEGDQNKERWGDSPLPLGPALQADFPQIKHSVRFKYHSITLRYKDKVFDESLTFVDPEFLEMFTFPVQSGEKTALSDSNGLILSKIAAEKYFGKENPIGKQVVVGFNKKHQESFFVKAVLKKMPLNSSLGFNIVGSIRKLEEFNPRDFTDWGKLVHGTFIQVSNPTDIKTIAGKADNYLHQQNSRRVDRPMSSFFFQPLASLSWASQNIRKSISSGSTPEALILFFVIGLFLLIQACFNYVNIALASGAGRLKEIGIRKVVGSKKLQLIYQFLGENLLLCFLSLLVGLLLTEFLLLPGLMQINGNQDPISLGHFFKNSHIWSFLVLLLLLTGICAGAYPALYISKLEPVRIFRGNFTYKSKKRFTSFLLAVQFSIAFVILCLVATFWQNNQYQLKREWGYSQENVFNITIENSHQFGILKNALGQQANIKEMAGTSHQIGSFEQQAVVEYEAKKHDVIRFDVGMNYLETLGVRLAKGRFFNRALSTDSSTALIVNEALVKRMDWQNPVGSTLHYDNDIYRVIGVVQDFHYDDFYNEIQPVIIRLVPENQFKCLTLRLKAGAGIESVATFKSTWSRLFPDSPYQARFQDSVFEQAFRSNEQITKIFAATATITLLISCMGLFGLVSLMISKRMKELAMHKVLGASLTHISRLITRRYVFLLLLSILFTIPFAFISLKALLDGVYPFHMELGAFPFIMATIVIMITAAATIATQVYKAACHNPIDSLRHE